MDLEACISVWNMFVDTTISVGQCTGCLYAEIWTLMQKYTLQYEASIWNSALTRISRNQFIQNTCVTKPVTGSFDGFFDLRLNQQLSTQWRCWWFETPSRSLWRHRNVVLPPIFITHTCTALLQQNTDIKQKHCYMLYWHAKTVTNYPILLHSYGAPAFMP